jgi:hypothetical protein
MDALNCVERAITERLGADDFIPQGVSNCLWAFGSLNRNRGYEITSESVDAFGEGILRHIDGFKSMELSNLVWATSTLRIQFGSPDVMAAMDAAMIDAAHNEPHFFSSQSISNILWAAGNHPDGVQLSGELLGVLADLSVRKFETFTPQGLSNSAWGFASVGFNPGGDFIDLAQARVVQGGSDVHRHRSRKLALVVLHLEGTPRGPDPGIRLPAPRGHPGRRHAPADDRQHPVHPGADGVPPTPAHDGAPGGHLHRRHATRRGGRRGRPHGARRRHVE